MEKINIFSPTKEHSMLRDMVKDFTKKTSVEPQAHEYDKNEKFNLDLLKCLGEIWPFRNHDL